MPVPALQADAVTHSVLPEKISLIVARHEHIAIVGPNGAGKSTLLRLLAGLLTPETGQIWLEGRALCTLSRTDIAQHIAWLSQTDRPAPEIITRDYIALGRLPFRHTSQAKQDHAAINTAIEHCEVASLLDTPFGKLSGGEQQRVMLARCLAQTPQILLLDEPTNHLDLAARSRFLKLLAQLPCTVIAVLHDLALVPQFAQRIILLDKGQIILDGTTEDVLFSPQLQAVFQLSVEKVSLKNGQSTFVFTALPS